MPAYRELPPPAPLRGAVACVWARRGESGVRVLPDGCADVVWTAGRGVVVAGPDTAAKVAATAPGDVIVGVRFAPGAGGAALGLPLDELRDLRVDAREFGLDVDPEADPRTALGALLAATARRFRDAPPDTAIGEAARQLQRGAPVRTLAADLGLSERQLRRRCHAAAGYGPKTLARVLRFRRFLAGADAAGTDADLSWLAFEAGYADQAHLTRECTRLAGLPPAALMRDRAGAPPARGSAAPRPR
jgi:AraC-like DNA-binding protein